MAEAKGGAAEAAARPTPTYNPCISSLETWKVSANCSLKARNRTAIIVPETGAEVECDLRTCARALPLAQECWIQVKRRVVRKRNIFAHN